MEESNGEYGRPRRPKPETVSYLSGLPLNEAAATKQVREYVAHFRKRNNGTNTNIGISGADNGGGDDGSKEEPPEYPPMLSAAHAALSSIFHEFASLACEEDPSQQIETLVRIACRYSHVAKRVVLAGMAGYWTFLSTHRFGSHVAQTVLRCAVAECEVNLDEFDDGQGQEGGGGEQRQQCEGKMVIEDSYAGLLRREDGSGVGVGGGGGAGPNSQPEHILGGVVDELRRFAPEMAVHICGSHVLRTSLCVLSGAEFVDAFAPPGSSSGATPPDGSICEWDTGALAATRRGKFKDKQQQKKKKKRGGAPTDEEKGNSRHEVTVVKAMNMVPELRTDDFRRDAWDAMNVMVDVIISSSSGEGEEGGRKKLRPPGKLQQLTCHPSAGPLLIQILRLLSYQSSQASKMTMRTKNSQVVPNRRLVILPQEPHYSIGSKAESFVHRLLCWDATIANNDEGDYDGGETSAKQPYAGDIIYGLSGEPRGSVLLDTIFRCCPDSFHDTLCNIGGFHDETTLREYIQHGVSNFVVQTLLMSVRSKDQASRMAKCLCGIVEDGSLVNVNRVGVIWRAFEMCATQGSSQDQERILSALSRGFASAFSGASSLQEERNEDSTGEENKRKRRSTAKGLSAEECIPHLLGLPPGSDASERENNRLTVNVEGARALYHILHFKERLRKDWVKGIVGVYGPEELSKIANDGLGSAW